MAEPAFLVFLQRSIARVQLELQEQGVDQDFVRVRCEARWARMSKKERLGFIVDGDNGPESDQQDDESQEIGQSSGDMQDALPSYSELAAEELYTEDRLEREPEKDEQVEKEENGKRAISSASQSTCKEKQTRNEAKLYCCNVCFKSFSSAGSLKTHMVNHGEKSFNCDLCSKSFLWASHLKQHELTHSGEKPHTCTLCNKSFAQYHYLKLHKATHRDEKPHSCTLCNKSFALHNYLKHHMRVYG
jgi:uncharacterized Zn-finger protein